MKILITGANGQLGYQLQRVFAGEEVLATDTDTLDITNREQVREVVADFRPDVVINTAAYTNVDGAEENKDIAFKVNAEGARNVAEAACEIGAKTVQISTDFIFDGKKGSAYSEEDETRPLSVYGASKLAGEKAVQEAGGGWIIVRTAWLYGERGKNFVETILRLADEKPELTVVDDQVGSPTYTKDLAEVIKLLMEKDASGIYHVVNGGECSWCQFAKEILRLANKDISVKPITGEQLARPAKRPSRSVLDMNKLQSLGIKTRSWQEALSECVANRAKEGKE